MNDASGDLVTVLKERDNNNRNKNNKHNQEASFSIFIRWWKFFRLCVCGRSPPSTPIVSLRENGQVETSSLPKTKKYNFFVINPSTPIDSPPQVYLFEVLSLFSLVSCVMRNRALSECPQWSLPISRTPRDWKKRKGNQIKQSRDWELICVVGLKNEDLAGKKRSLFGHFRSKRQ